MLKRRGSCVLRRYGCAFLAVELLSAAAVLLGGLAIMRRAPRGAALHARRWKEDAESAGCDTDIQVRPPRRALLRAAAERAARQRATAAAPAAHA